MKYTAVGIHAFAGGFTQGVKRVMGVQTHLETHGFGVETAEKLCGVRVINVPNADWPDVAGDLAFGNPRCTAFSTTTVGSRWGEDANMHGAFAKQTCDIEQMCEYAAGRYPIVVWESVQGAFKVGRPLVDKMLREHFRPQGYRLAHILLNAASFGNPQQRKRYFFVAYRGDKNFNIEPPSLPQYATLAYDVLKPHWDRRVTEHPQGEEMGPDHHARLCADEWECLPNLPNGWNINLLAKFAPHLLSERYRFMWESRCSEMPFSMHCLFRMNPLRPSPTLVSSSGHTVHPCHHRTLSLREAAATMGWEGTPVGKMPIGQIAKGIVPATGEWVARQAALYLDDAWGSEDWESSFDDVAGEWVGGDADGREEKVFDLTRYTPKAIDEERYADVPAQFHRYDVGSGATVRAIGLAGAVPGRRRP